MVVMPFIESNFDNNSVIRVFSSNTDDVEFVWHRDREDRIITPTHDTDWMLQLDGEIPKKISGDVFICAGRYHRLIKGSNDLTLIIKKFEK